MARKHETEALVVGAGPVGMLAALALAERDVKVEVVDEEWRAAARSYALALHPASLELLDEAGLATELVEQGHRISRVAFYDRTERRAEVYPAELPRAFPFLLVLPQKALEAALERRLERHGVKVRWNHRLAGLSLDGDRPAATVERLAKESTGYSVATTVWVVEAETETTADFVLGTDGHRSAVRQALGAALEPIGQPELYAVFEFASDAADLDEVRVVLDEGATSVLWPLGGGRFRWSFQVDSSTVDVARPDKSRLAVQVGRNAYPFLSRDDLAGLIARRAPWFEGAIGDLEWSVAVRFERRLAASFGHGGAWLAGDSAHLAPPVGVHSMNGGLDEAHDLAARIARVLRRGSPRDLLEAYGRERRAGWRRLLEGRVEAGPQAPDWVRQHAARIVPCLPGLGPDLDRLAAQLGLKLV